VQGEAAAADGEVAALGRQGAGDVLALIAPIPVSRFVHDRIPETDAANGFRSLKIPSPRTRPPSNSGAAAGTRRYFEEMLAYFAKQSGVAFWNGQQIYDWFIAQQPKP
jgi:hypothetical protein